MTTFEMAYEWNNDIDPKIPVLRGETLKDFKTYKQAVTATALSIGDDEKKRLGPKLYRNLLGLSNSISVLVEQLDPATLANDDGHKTLLAYLETNRFSVSAFKEVPRAYDVLFERTRFRKDCEEPMTAYCTAMEVARRDLEAVDTGTKISD